MAKFRVSAQATLAETHAVSQPHKHRETGVSWTSPSEKALNQAEFSSQRRTRLTTRKRIGWFRLPTELRHAIVYEVICMSLPVSREAEAKTSYWEAMTTLASLNYAFTRRDLITPCYRVAHELTGLYDRLSASSDEVLVMTKGLIDDLVPSPDFDQRRNRIAYLLNMTKEIGDLMNYVIKCTKPVVNTMTFAKRLGVSLLLSNIAGFLT